MSFLALPVQAAEDYLTGEQLKALIVGKTIRSEVYYASSETAYDAEYNDAEGRVLSYNFLEGDEPPASLYAESAGNWKIVGNKFCYRWESAPEAIQCHVQASKAYIYEGFEVLDQAKGMEK